MGVLVKGVGLWFNPLRAKSPGGWPQHQSTVPAHESAPRWNGGHDARI